MARLLDIERAHALGLIAGVWAFAAQHAPDGCLASFDGAEIESWVAWSGTEGALIRSLVSARLLDETDRGLEVHDWPEYTSGLREAERKRRYREKLRTRPDDPAGPGTDARRTRDGNVPPTNGRTNERTNEASSVAPLPEPGGVCFAVKGGRWSPRPEFIAELRKLFPSSPVDLTLREAQAWCEANPSKRKTPAGMPRFLLGWFSRAAEKPTNGSTRAPRPPEPVLVRAPRGVA